MHKAKIAAKEPALVELKGGTAYAWCSCGKSSNQPWCTGAHKNSGFTPIIFRVEKDKSETLCQCKQTKTPPYCDNSHMELL